MNLLVSVRSPIEAEAALAGGAAVIDVKEPARGALGRADQARVDEVIRTVTGRCPVSAALGELAEGDTHVSAQGLSFVKWGLSGLSFLPDWPGVLEKAGQEIVRQHPDCRPVAVAYADWQRAAAPPVAAVCHFACSQRWRVLLVDTWGKDGTTLLDWITVPSLERLRDDCRSAGVRLALAGSLGLDEIRVLCPLRPDWFAVRSAACRSGSRTQPIDTAAVRRLVEAIHAPFSAVPAAG
jgi:hypothetical protein